jgi:hypothetical protein
MRFNEPTKWELFLDGFHNFLYAWECYDDEDYRWFWEALNLGFYTMEIYDYDDPFNRTISPERKLRLGQ